MASFGREEKLNSGLRKLQEFQRRKDTPSVSDHVSVALQRRPSPAPATAPARSPSAVTPATPVPPSTVSYVRPPEATGSSSEVGGRLSQLVNEISLMSVSACSQDLSLLEEFQRRCAEFGSVIATAQAQNGVLVQQVEQLQSCCNQQLRTIDILVEEKSRLKMTAEGAEEMVKRKDHKVQIAEAELRTLKERLVLQEGQVLSLKTPQPCQTCVNSESSVALKQQIDDLLEAQRQANERLQNLQWRFEQACTAVQTSQKELSVAQAYIQQLSGGTEKDTSTSQEVDSLREEVSSLTHEKSASELICRNLEASNKGLQDAVADLSRQLHQAKNQLSQSIAEKELLCASENVVSVLQQSSSVPSVIMVDAGVDALQDDAQKEKESLEDTVTELKDELSYALQRLALNADELQKAKMDVSRACTQNRELKIQLEQLQDAFVIMSNEKLDLTEKLQSELHKSQQYEAGLHQLRLQIAQYQAQDKAARDRQMVLDKEIEQCKEQLAVIEKKHSTCKDRMVRMQSKLNSLKSSEETTTGPTKTNDSPSISEYEFIDRTPDSSVVICNPNESDDNFSTSSRSSNNALRDASDTSLSLNHANEKGPTSADLESKLHEALNRIEILTEQKNYLEHQVDQLQMETDTISDYIQLYQQQRAAVNKRAADKEFHIRQLLGDREQLKNKVHQLQALVVKILPTDSESRSSGTLSGRGSRAGAGDIGGIHDADVTHEAEIHKDLIARKILSTLQDLDQVSTNIPDSYRCTSCTGCHGRLISL